MLSLILNIVAPMAVAERETRPDVPFSEFVDNLCRGRRTKSNTDSKAVFRVDGHLFADIESRRITKGKAADPAHYDKIAFDVIVEDQKDGTIRLKAQQRIIFGWLETEAVSEALGSRLEQLLSDGHDAHS